jgi:transposase-like protein
MSILSDPIFHDEAAAYAFLESIIWPGSPVCPHCGGVERISPMKGKSTRIGTYKCYQCRKPLTVKVGTVFESSKVPLHKWLQATYLMCASKKGISAHQLHRTIEVSYPTAWFMEHRIREAMRSGELAPMAAWSRSTRRSSATTAASSRAARRRVAAMPTSTWYWR